MNNNVIQTQGFAARRWAIRYSLRTPGRHSRMFLAGESSVFAFPGAVKGARE
jgi:hypothetical protein